jgi:hypothetical protein
VGAKPERSRPPSARKPMPQLDTEWSMKRGVIPRRMYPRTAIEKHFCVTDRSGAERNGLARALVCEERGALHDCISHAHCSRGMRRPLPAMRRARAAHSDEARCWCVVTTQTLRSETMSRSTFCTARRRRLKREFPGFLSRNMRFQLGRCTAGSARRGAAGLCSTRPFAGTQGFAHGHAWPRAGLREWQKALAWPLHADPRGKEQNQ